MMVGEKQATEVSENVNIDTAVSRKAYRNSIKDIKLECFAAS